MNAKDRKALEAKTEVDVGDALRAAGVSILAAERDGAWSAGLPEPMRRALVLALTFGAALPSAKA